MRGLITVTSSSGRVSFYDAFLQIALLKDSFVSDCFIYEETEGAIFEGMGIALWFLIYSVLKVPKDNDTRIGM